MQGFDWLVELTDGTADEPVTVRVAGDHANTSAEAIAIARARAVQSTNRTWTPTDRVWRVECCDGPLPHPEHPPTRPYAEVTAWGMTTPIVFEGWMVEVRAKIECPSCGAKIAHWATFDASKEHKRARERAEDAAIESDQTVGD